MTCPRCSISVTGFGLSKPKQIQRQMSTGCEPSSNSLIHSNTSVLTANIIHSPSVPSEQPSWSFSTPSTLVGPSTWQEPVAHVRAQSVAKASSLVSTKNHSNMTRTSEERELMNKTVARFALQLALDHETVLEPDTDTPFLNQTDVIKRLLPYHIFQQPQEDLDFVATSKVKGKEKQTDIAIEVAETKFALQCYTRRKSLVNRFRRAKICSGKRAALDDQAYVLAQAVLEADRAETTWLSNELRTARAELERIEREKRLATNSTRMTQFPTAAMPSMQAQYYRAYPYAYTQTYGSPVPANSTSTFSITPTASSSPVMRTPAYTTTAYQSSSAIPVQLPVSSLPSLHQLGINPVPATSLPPEGQPQPPAVLRGSSANGTMLSLEINVSLLQSAQMSGLAYLLNSLMSRSSGASATGNSTTNNTPTGSVASKDMNPATTT